MVQRPAKRGPRRKPGARTKTGATERITRAQFDGALEAVNQRVRVLQVQFRRMPEMQAELDTVKRVVERLAEQISAIASSIAAITTGTA